VTRVQIQLIIKASVHSWQLMTGWNTLLQCCWQNLGEKKVHFLLRESKYWHVIVFVGSVNVSSDMLKRFIIIWSTEGNFQTELPWEGKEVDLSIMVYVMLFAIFVPLVWGASYCDVVSCLIILFDSCLWCTKVWLGTLRLMWSKWTSMYLVISFYVSDKYW